MARPGPAAGVAGLYPGPAAAGVRDEPPAPRRQRHVAAGLRRADGAERGRRGADADHGARRPDRLGAQPGVPPRAAGERPGPCDVRPARRCRAELAVPAAPALALVVGGPRDPRDPSDGICARRQSIEEVRTSPGGPMAARAPAWRRSPTASRSSSPGKANTKSKLPPAWPGPAPGAAADPLTGNPPAPPPPGPGKPGSPGPGPPTRAPS